MPAFSLDIQSGSAAIAPARVALVGQSLIVGRTRDAQIVLDSKTISRRHAEFYGDPFGRWWIRDLGSHNGTLVNGQRVKEQVLKAGDLIQVGEFSLALVGPEQPVLAEANGAGGGGAAAQLPVVEAQGGRIAALRDFESPRLAAMHLSILSDFGQQLLSIESPLERLEALCGLMVRKEFHGRTAVALRASKESFTEPAKPLCTAKFSGAGAGGDDGQAPYISRTLLRTLLARNEPVLASNASVNLGNAQTNVTEMSMASDVMTISAVACPIYVQPGHTDLLYVLFPPEYGNSEWLALTALAVKQFLQAEFVWNSREQAEKHSLIERELSRANEIQKRLIPRNVTVPGLDFAIGFVPCRWVGGDYVDIVKASDGRVLLAIADVCGKGLPAALVASSLHMLTHTAMRIGASLPDMMGNLNAYLADTLSEGTFVTMIGAMLDPAQGTLEIINAGHPAGLLISPEGAVSLTQQEANMPLGLDAGAELASATTALPRDAYFVMYTDGLSELHIADGKLLGDEQLAADIAGLVRGGGGAATGELSAKLTALLDSRQEGMSSDDRTFLIARRV